MENDVVTSRQSRESGFTLIELLVVLIILGILAAIAILSFTGATRFSNIKACEADVVSVNAALNAYASDYPYSASGLSSDTQRDLYGSGTLSTAAERYLAPLDPSNKTVYEVTFTTATTGVDTPGALPYKWTITVKNPTTNGYAIWDSQSGGLAGIDATGAPITFTGTPGIKGLCSQVIS